MSKIARTLSALTSLALALTLFSGCTGKKKSAGPTNAELKIGVTQEFETFNPLIMSMVASTYMSAMVNRQMIFMDASGKWQPQLAVSIPTLENGGAKILGTGKSRTIESNWEIRENAKWGDGTPVTCEDIKFSWQVGLNENVSIASREGYQTISDIVVDATNPKKCTIKMNKVRFDYYQLVPTPLPKHLEGPVLAEFGSQKEGYDKNTNYTKNPTNPGLYNGPYLVTDIKLGSHVAFARNPHFYGPQAKIEKIIVKLIPNNTALEANLRSGTIDMVSTLGFTFDQALAFEKKVTSEKLPYNVNFQPSCTYEHIDLNLDNKILQDVKVRHALLHAINREELSKALFEGKQRPAIHFLSPVDPMFTEDPAVVRLYPFDITKAGQLLDEAGWKPGPDGIRTKGGERLSLVFMTTAGNKTRETVQTLLQAQWRAVGIEVTIKNEPARVFFSETMNKRKFPALAMYAWVSSPDSTYRSTLHSSSIPSEKNSWSGQNYTGWKNPTADSLIQQFEEEFDPAKRAEITKKIITEYTADAPVIPLYYRSDISVIPANLEGYKLTGHLFYDTHTVENWNLK